MSYSNVNMQWKLMLVSLFPYPIENSWKVWPSIVVNLIMIAINKWSNLNWLDPSVGANRKKNSGCFTKLQAFF